MPDWAAARSFTGDPLDVFVAIDEILELLNRAAWHADAACRGHDRRLWALEPPDTLAGIWAAPATGTGGYCGRRQRPSPLVTPS